MDIYISWKMTPTSIGGEKQAGIRVGVNPPADIASGRIAEVRSRSMSCNCMTRTSQQECRGILEYREGKSGCADEVQPLFQTERMCQAHGLLIFVLDKFSR